MCFELFAAIFRKLCVSILLIFLLVCVSIKDEKFSNSKFSCFAVYNILPPTPEKKVCLYLMKNGKPVEAKRAGILNFQDISSCQSVLFCEVFISLKRFVACKFNLNLKLDYNAI